MSGSVTLSQYGRYLSFILGIAGCLAALVFSDITAITRAGIGISITALVVLGALSLPAGKHMRFLSGYVQGDTPTRHSNTQRTTSATSDFHNTIPDTADSKRDLSYMYENLEDAWQLARLGQEVAGTAHELNNPLGGILMYANLIAEQTDPGDPNYSNLGKIIREAERCRSIVRRLLDISPQAPPKATGADLDNLLSEALANIFSDVNTSGIIVRKNYRKPLSLIKGDNCEIQEVFENLLRNAVEAINGQGEIDITVQGIEHDGGPGVVEISIADSGPGIAPEDHAHLFEPFYTTKHRENGSGLGLAVSSSIITRHGGTIHASNHAGGGAVFTVRLPIAEEGS